jgi:hypothetical protein
MNFSEQAHIARLMTFAQRGQPAGYAASDMMRADLDALIRSAALAQLQAGKTARPDEHIVWCDCGDGIVPDSGAKCGTCAAIDAAPAVAQMLTRNVIFEAGWRLAAKWANRDDLYHDTTSAAYVRDRDAVLAEFDKLVAKNGLTLPEGENNA